MYAAWTLDYLRCVDVCCLPSTRDKSSRNEDENCQSCPVIAEQEKQLCMYYYSANVQNKLNILYFNHLQQLKLRKRVRIVALNGDILYIQYVHLCRIKVCAITKH